MQPQSRLKLLFAILFSLPLFCGASEEHLIIDRGHHVILHSIDGVETVADNQSLPWSLVFDAYSDSFYWSELSTGAIYHRSLGGGSISTIYSDASAVMRGLVLDTDSNRLYFLDSDKGTLNELQLNTLSNTVLATGFVRPNDMVMDRTHLKLYITDSGQDLVGCYNLSNNTYAVIHSGTDLDGVWGIDLLPAGNTLFLSDFHNHSILRMDLDGANPTTLVSSQTTPRGLRVDRHQKRIYWLEAVSGMLRSSEYDGSDVKDVLSSVALSAPRDLESFEGLDKDDDFLSDSWEQRNFGNLLQQGTDDPDGDHIDNFTEMAFGSSPTNSTNTPMGSALAFDDDEDNPILTYQFNTDTWMTYSLMHSSDLQQWDPVMESEELETSTSGTDLAMRTMRLYGDFGSNHFFRVEATR